MSEEMIKLRIKQIICSVQRDCMSCILLLYQGKPHKTCPTCNNDKDATSAILEVIKEVKDGK